MPFHCAVTSMCHAVPAGPVTVPYPRCHRKERFTSLSRSKRVLHRNGVATDDNAPDSYGDAYRLAALLARVTLGWPDKP
eukprot:6187406-Pleurochrysis_carterae.AAC.1